MSSSKRLKILSLDGGGFRGLSSLIMLQTIFNMFRANLDPPQPDLEPCDFFDLIVGTSTGGIIAIMLGRLRMSLEDCIDTYSALGEKVFGKEQGFGHEERFDATRLEEAIQQIVGSVTGDKMEQLLDPLGDKCCKVAVCTFSQYNIGTPKPKMLQSYQANGIILDKRLPWTIWEAARATSAAFTFFKALTRGEGYRAVSYFDAGFGHNNPALVALSEAGRIWGSYETLNQKDIGLFLSLGTGVPTILRAKESRTIVDEVSARLKVPLELVDAMNKMMTNTETVAYQMSEMFSSPSPPQVYFRFNVEQGLSSIQLFDYEKEEQIRADTETHIDKRRVEVVRCADHMKSLMTPEAPIAEDARMDRLRMTSEASASREAYSPMVCTSNNCGISIKWQQLVYWCISDNKCVCENCYRARTRSGTLSGNIHALKLKNVIPIESGRRCSVHVFSSMIYFQGVTCGYCNNFHVCQKCIRSDRTRKLFAKHACKSGLGGTTLWLWEGNKNGVKDAWPTSTR